MGMNRQRLSNEFTIFINLLSQMLTRSKCKKKLLWWLCNSLF